jgi:hypothetical protein
MHLRTQKNTCSTVAWLDRTTSTHGHAFECTSRDRLNLSCMRDIVITAARPSCIACVMDGWLVVMELHEERLFP